MAQTTIYACLTLLTLASFPLSSSFSFLSSAGCTWSPEQRRLLRSLSEWPRKSRKPKTAELTRRWQVTLPVPHTILILYSAQVPLEQSLLLHRAPRKHPTHNRLRAGLAVITGAPASAPGHSDWRAALGEVQDVSQGTLSLWSDPPLLGVLCLSRLEVRLSSQVWDQLG
jgi:hypothetical protein